LCCFAHEVSYAAPLLLDQKQSIFLGNIQSTAQQSSRTACWQSCLEDECCLARFLKKTAPGPEPTLLLPRQARCPTAAPLAQQTLPGGQLCHDAAARLGCHPGPGGNLVDGA
jgi:hypothetical protein